MGENNNSNNNNNNSNTSRPKQKHKKGLWSPDEDQKLRNYILKHGHGCWSSVPINAGLQRNGKSCRLRWINYLRPGLKRGSFNLHEEETILALHTMWGNKWSQIAHHLPGRTDNEIKNFWHSYLKKRVAKMAKNNERSMENNNGESSSGNDSFGHIETSLTDTDQSIPNNKTINPPPKILFAEWLSLDQFNGHKNNSIGFNNSSSFNNVSSEFQDSLMQGLLFDESVAYDHNIHPIINNVAVNHEDLFHQQLNHISEPGFAELFSAGFDVNNDIMYI